MSAPPPPEASRSAAAQARGEPAAGRHGGRGSARSASLSRPQSRRGRGGRPPLPAALRGPRGGSSATEWGSPRRGGPGIGRRDPRGRAELRAPRRRGRGRLRRGAGRPPPPLHGQTGAVVSASRGRGSPTTRACGRWQGLRRRPAGWLWRAGRPADAVPTGRRRAADGAGGPRCGPCKMEATWGPVYSAQQMAAGAAERADCENPPRGRVCRDDATPGPAGRVRGALLGPGPPGGCRRPGSAGGRVLCAACGREKGKSARPGWKTGSRLRQARCLV